MKIKIPDELKTDMPQTMWSRILMATPIVMTVLATALAGLASSEMTRAQYSRSLAAQQQSKAGDQWSFFQAKRLRSALQRNTLDIVQSTTEVHPLNSSVLDKSGITADSALGKQTLIALQQGQLPKLEPAPALDPKVKAALDAIESSASESELIPIVSQVDDRFLVESLRQAKDRATTFDHTVAPISQTIEQLENQLNRQEAGLSAARDFTAARLRYTALRYDAESRVNQAIANLYELQVRKSNFDAERHHKRSKQFFYGMLAAQAGVIIATFSIAARKRNLLWSLAAAAGAAALSFAIYVYMFV